MSTYWINNSSLEEYNKMLNQKKIQYFDIKDKNKISRMKKGDKIIYFLNDKDLFIGISEVKSDNYDEINNDLISIKIKKSKNYLTKIFHQNFLFYHLHENSDDHSA